MPRFAANLSMMYTEHRFLDRFGAAAADGFGAVEFMFPYDIPHAEIAARQTDHGLQLVLFNAPPGDSAAGERGLACLPDRRHAFRRSIVEQALPYALALQCPRLHVMAGLMPAGIERAGLRATYVSNLAWAAREAASMGIDLLIEPINKRDVPGYFLNDFAFARDLILELKIPNLKLQFDIYHCQILHGDVTVRLREMMPIVGHVQIASVPSRNEPDGEELNYPFLFDELDRLGYAGFVGCEYRPRGNTDDGLGWFAPYAGAIS
jgi:hydroxypyruvate isomerase